MGWVKTSYRFIEVCLLVVLCAGLALAQSNRGTLAGTVLDSSGSAIAGATITATGAQTGVVYKATSNTTGGYRIGDMQVGVYDVTVEAQSFKKLTSTGITVDVNNTTARDFTMQPGGATEVVTVTGDLPNIESETSDVGTVVTQKQILELPLALGGQGDLRSPEAFVFLTPGTTGPGSADRNDGAFLSKLGGGQNFGTEVLVDGASTVRADSGAAFDQTAPSVEALDEFKVTTSTLPAEYGRTTGGVESFTTKSGTNTFHGSLYELFRNEALDANAWFNDLNIAADPANAANFRKTNDKKHDFGGTFGGPVWIPKLYNGRNKTFFFFSWEQYLQKLGGNPQSTLPTDALRNGDFSSLLDTNPADSLGTNPCGGSIQPGQIFDPNTTRLGAGNVLCRDPFPNNKIDPARISTVAKNILALVPEPNLPGTSQNFIFLTTNPRTTTTTTVRVDQNLGEKDKVFFSYSSRENTSRNGTPSLPEPLSNGAQIQDFTTHYMRAGWDRAFSPTLLNHLNVGYNRVNSFDRAGAVDGTDWPSQVGLQGASGQTFPVIFFGPEPFAQLGQAVYADDVDNGIVVADSVSLTRGRHTLRFGFDWRYQQFSKIDFAGGSGEYDFDRTETAATPTLVGPTGNAFAGFLLGAVDKGSLRVRAGQPRWISNYYAGYVQDEFKVSRTLMLNLGFRYDIETPRHEALDNASIFDPTVPNPGANGFPGAIVFAGKGNGRSGRSSAWVDSYKKDVAPRIGFAYAPDRFGGKMVFRGGYGIYYGPLDYADFGSAGTLGFSAEPSFTNQVNFFDPAFLLDNGVPSFPAPPNLDPAQANGQGGSAFGGVLFISPDYARPGMIQNWSFEIQRDLGANFSLNVGYIGQHATRLRSSLACINCINPSNFRLGNTLNSDISSPEAAAAGVTLPYPSFTGTVAQALRPFPQYGNIDTDCCLENLGQSTYHALLAKAERRFHSGLNVLASYTWSKTLTDSDSALPAFSAFQGGGTVQNPFNLRGEKSLSNQDIPHTFVVSYIYELPLGPGKKFLNQHGPVGKIVGGWQVGGVQRYQSGQPISFGCASGAPAFDPTNGTCFRFSRVQGQPLLSSRANADDFNPLVDTFFNAPLNTVGDNHFAQGVVGPNGINGAFQDPNFASLVDARGFAFGDLPRTTAEVRSPAFLNEDFSIIKRTQATERLNVVFKAELLNAFNRHVLSRPNANGPYDANFGRFFGTVDAQRQIQLILRLEF
jgi:hypothetical protein